MTENIDEGIVNLINNLEYNEAYQQILKKITDIPSFAKYSFTLLKLNVLIDNYEFAVQTVRKIEEVLSDNYKIPDTLFYRMRIMWPELNPSEECFRTIRTNSKWLEKYLSTGDDTPVEPDLGKVSVLNRFYSSYRIETKCPDCGGNYIIDIVGSLLLFRITICPECFMRHLITTKTVRRSIEKNYACLLNHDNDKYIFPVKQLQIDIEDNSKNSEIPILVKYMNQGAIFKLNEIIMTELLKGGYGK